MSIKISKILERKVWIESDMFGDRHVCVRYEGTGVPSFTYATFHYHHAYTSNYGTLKDAEDLARQLGATDPIEIRNRELRK